MDKLEELEQECHDIGVEIIQRPFDSQRIKGLYCDNCIALHKNLANKAEKSCTLAEELGHHYTTLGDITDLSSPANKKQELKARTWAYQQLLDLSKLIDCFRYGCSSVHEAAEYLEVTEAFFLQAMVYYKQHYGLQKVVGSCMISFEPFGIFEIYPQKTTQND